MTAPWLPLASWLVPVGQTVADHLRQVVAGRPVYVHIDCDVLDVGTVPTDYLVPGGLTLDQLHACAEALAESPVVGIEVGEPKPTTTSRPPGTTRSIVAALEPLLHRSRSQPR